MCSFLFNSKPPPQFIQHKPGQRDRLVGFRLHTLYGPTFSLFV